MRTYLYEIDSEAGIVPATHKCLFGGKVLKLHISRTLCALAFIAVPLTSLAHHSHGNYDLLNYKHLDGTVNKVIWLNPHVWVYLSVDDGQGTTETWALEGGGINAVMSRGWTKESLQIGDPISVRCHALRDGANGCLLGYVKTEDGVEREYD